MIYRIMLIDDEVSILKALKRILTHGTDWEVEAFSDPGEALRRAHVANFDLFLSDYRMPEIDGVKFLSEIKLIQPDAMRLILSGYSDLDALLSAINQANIYRFICKPWDNYELKSTLEGALAYREMLVENRRLADTVRLQQQELENRKSALERLQESNPELVAVNWADDGSIILDA